MHDPLTFSKCPVVFNHSYTNNTAMHREKSSKLLDTNLRCFFKSRCAQWSQKQRTVRQVAILVKSSRSYFGQIKWTTLKQGAVSKVQYTTESTVKNLYFLLLIWPDTYSFGKWKKLLSLFRSENSNFFFYLRPNSERNGCMVLKYLTELHLYPALCNF